MATPAQAQELSSQEFAVSPRVVGGTAQPISYAPWQVALISNGASNNYQGQFCGGSIISASWIVTAAHCVANLIPSDIRILAGSAELSLSVLSGTTVTAIHVHPSYNSLNYLNDIALLQLSAPLTLQARSVQAIALPSTKAPGSTPARVSGWGSMTSTSGGGPASFPSTLQGATINVFSDSTCATALNAAFYATEMLCGGRVDNSIDTCQGDSGGPLATYRNDRWELSGVTSWGYGCAYLYPGVYTNVQNYTSWITSISSVAVPPQVIFSSTPTITGTARVGSTVTATVSGWGPAPLSYSYVWYRNGVAVSSSGPNYVLTAADLNRTITVAVTASKPGFSNRTRTSAGVTGRAGLFAVSPTPTISGTLRAGSMLTANTGVWSPVVGSYRYQWFRDGVPVAGAVGPQFGLTGFDVGRSMSVRVTGLKPGFISVNKFSAPTAAIGPRL